MTPRFANLLRYQEPSQVWCSALSSGSEGWWSVRKLAAIFLFLLATVLPRPADADPVTIYEISWNLDLVSGPDVLGLAEADFFLTFAIDHESANGGDLVTYGDWHPNSPRWLIRGSTGADGTYTAGTEGPVVGAVGQDLWFYGYDFLIRDGYYFDMRDGGFTALMESTFDVPGYRTPYAFENDDVSEWVTYGLAHDTALWDESAFRRVNITGRAYNVPEPATWLLVGIGAVGLFLRRRPFGSSN